ncbi:MAG: flagellar basal body L-ring protein FlgH [Spirochaetes bacterium]|nr:flagellar basal body L-ring protein FlgH [Spirochaetota bacterium]
MMKRVPALAIMILLWGAAALSRSIWVEKNIYSTSEQLGQGDTVVVNILDISTMQFDLSVDNKNNFTISSNPDKNITGFLPKVSGDRQIKSDDKTSFATKGKIRFSMATRVMNKAAGNAYAIAGSKTFNVNGISSIITVTGLVDPALVRGRTIDSNNVADFSIEIRGVREGFPIRREKLKEGEAATVTLTEEEKYQIIIDYLQKMIGEITR